MRRATASHMEHGPAICHASIDIVRKTGGGEMGNWALVVSDDVDALLGTGELWGYMGGELRMPVAAYLCVVILILMTATSFRPSDAVPLRAILIAAFCWPVTVPVLVWRAWENR